MRSLNRKRRQGASSENHPTAHQWRALELEVKERHMDNDRQLDMWPAQVAQNRVRGEARR